MSPKLKRFKDRIRSLIGIKYNVTEEPEIIPIMPERNTNDGIGKLLAKLSVQVKNRKAIYSKYTELSRNHLVESILNKVTNDVLFKGRDRNSPLVQDVIYEPDPSRAEEFKKVLEDYRIETHIQEVMYDTLLYGEYNLFTDYLNRELDDRFDYEDILSIYSRGRIKKVYLSDNNKLKPLDHKDLFSIALLAPGRRVKLKIKDKTGSEYYARIPSPFIPLSVIKLLNYISLMEMLIPLAQLMKIDKGQLVTIGVPPGTPIPQMFEICKKYEQSLNSRFSSSLGSFSFDSVEDILQSFGKYKTIPTIGGGKASMDVRDLPMSRDIETQDFDYLVRTLANRLDVPVSYIIYSEGSDDPKEKLSYLSKVQFIRNNLSDSIKNFLLNYDEYIGTKHGRSTVNPDKLFVKLPPVPGVESIDAVDYADALSGTLSNVQGLIDGLVSTLREAPKELDIKALTDVYNAKLEPLLGRKIFTGKVTRESESEEE